MYKVLSHIYHNGETRKIGSILSEQECSRYADDMIKRGLIEKIKEPQEAPKKKNKDK